MKIVKKYSAIFLLLAVLVNAMQVPIIYLDFQLNKLYIAKNLCENKDKPITVCGGKCYLGKQLKKVQETDNNQEKPVLRKIQVENFFTLVDFQFETWSSLIIMSKVSTSYQIFISSAHLDQIFHPPRQV